MIAALVEGEAARVITYLCVFLLAGAGVYETFWLRKG